MQASYCFHSVEDQTKVSGGDLLAFSGFYYKDFGNRQRCYSVEVLPKRQLSPFQERRCRENVDLGQMVDGLEAGMWVNLRLACSRYVPPRLYMHCILAWTLLIGQYVAQNKKKDTQTQFRHLTIGIGAQRSTTVNGTKDASFFVI